MKLRFRIEHIRLFNLELPLQKVVTFYRALQTLRCLYETWTNNPFLMYLVSMLNGPSFTEILKAF
jgi:hypothetical protein